jgi:transposase
MESAKNYIGIDVSKLTFDVALEIDNTYQYHQFSNGQDGFKALITLIKLLESNCLVVMEASGAYYLQLATYLYQQGVSVSVINPLVIRRFCQMRLSRTKTDKKDARMIAEYGKAEQPGLWQPDPDYVLQLRQMQAAVEGLNKSRTCMVRQLEAFAYNTATSKDVAKSLQRAIAAIEKEICTLEQKMEQLVENYHESVYKHLQSIPGVGKKTAMMLIVATGAFQKFSNSKQLSVYFGLSPRIFESGTSVKGKSRITKMGMSRIRALLYICAWSAKRCNKACKELYDRLLAKGKSKRLALVAVANKLLKQAFAITNNNTPYLPV